MSFSHRAVGYYIALCVPLLIEVIYFQSEDQVCSRVIFVLWKIKYVRYSREGMFNQRWKIVGMAAGMTYTLLTVLSLQPIRKRYYEFFVVTHIILATCVLFWSR